MRRDAFMKELEYLLQDIPDEDKADAIAYYQDYLEEAGPENEEKVIQDFGSPERIAAIIRADICGNLEDGGEFTEKGYEDGRFKEPNLELATRDKEPQEEEAAREEDAGSYTAEGQTRGNKETAPGGRRGYGMGNEANGGYGAGTGRRGGYGSGVNMDKAPSGQEKGRWEWWQILGMIILGCCVVPVVIPLMFGIGGGAVGLLMGLFGLLLGFLVTISFGLAAVTIALLLIGILLVIVAFGQMGVNLIQGILCLGTGVGVFGLSLLCLSLCGLYYGMFLPWLVKCLIHGISRLIHRKEAPV